MDIIFTCILNREFDFVCEFNKLCYINKFYHFNHLIKQIYKGIRKYICQCKTIVSPYLTSLLIVWVEFKHKVKARLEL